MNSTDLDSVEQTEWDAYFAERSDRTAVPLLRRHALLVHVQVRKLASAARAAGPSVDEGDLMAVGSQSLLSAIRRFNPSNGVPFAAFATMCIHGALVDELRRHSPLTRSDRAFIRRYDEAEAALGHELGRMPTGREIADRLGDPLVSVSRQRARVMARAMESLDQHLAVSSDPEWFATAVASAEADAEADMGKGEMRAMVASIPHDRARLVINRMFFEDATQAEVAAELGVSRQRVGQLLAAGLDLLRVKVIASMADDELLSLLQ